MASKTSTPTRSGRVVAGVDTHKYVQVAAAMDPVGGILATLTVWPLIPAGSGNFWAGPFPSGISSRSASKAPVHKDRGLNSFIRRPENRRRECRIHPPTQGHPRDRSEGPLRCHGHRQSHAHPRAGADAQGRLRENTDYARPLPASLRPRTLATPEELHATLLDRSHGDG